MVTPNHEPSTGLELANTDNAMMRTDTMGTERLHEIQRIIDKSRVAFGLPTLTQDELDLTADAWLEVLADVPPNLLHEMYLRATQDPDRNKRFPSNPAELLQQFRSCRAQQPAPTFGEADDNRLALKNAQVMNSTARSGPRKWFSLLDEMSINYPEKQAAGETAGGNKHE